MVGNILIYFVIGPILIATVLYIFPSQKWTRIFAVVSQLVILAGAVFLFLQARETTAIIPAFEGLHGFVTPIGGFESVMGIVLMADTLSAVFIMMTAFMYLIAIIYGYNENNSPKFWFLIFLWQSTMMGIFLTTDFFNIFVLMEVATVVVAVLIMLNRKTRALYDGMIYFMINVISMQFFLLGAGYIYKYTGTLSIYVANYQFQDISRGYVVLPYALIMTFVVLKSALIPLYSWLPKAHGTPGAPSTVSALLSGLHIKSSVYLLVRFNYTFSVVAATEFFLVMGIVTAIVGFTFALAQKDIKLILAYHTISQIGLIIAGFNVGGPYSFYGALYHMVNHALFKSTLFLSAGIIAYAYKTRNVYNIKGVFKTMPLVGLATILAVFGITGTPIFNGSISKYFIGTGVYGYLNWLLIFMSLGTIVSFIKYSTILFGPKNEEITKKVDIMQQIPILILGSLCFLGGLFGQQAINFLFNTQVSIDSAGYLEKMGIFAASFGLGFLIYKFYVKKSKFLLNLRQFELGFREINIALGTFFAALILIVGVFYT